QGGVDVLVAGGGGDLAAAGEQGLEAVQEGERDRFAALLLHGTHRALSRAVAPKGVEGALGLLEPALRLGPTGLDADLAPGEPRESQLVLGVLALGDGDAALDVTPGPRPPPLGRGDVGRLAQRMREIVPV